MRKGVADIPERARVSEASNGRYLEALAAVDTPLPLKSLTDELSRPVKWKKHQVRGLNLLGRDDAALLEAVGRGEFVINGLRNRDLRALLFDKPAARPGATPAERAGDPQAEDAASARADPQSAPHPPLPGQRQRP